MPGVVGACKEHGNPEEVMKMHDVCTCLFDISCASTSCSQTMHCAVMMQNGRPCILTAFKIFSFADA